MVDNIICCLHSICEKYKSGINSSNITDVLSLIKQFDSNSILLDFVGYNLNNDMDAFENIYHLVFATICKVDSLMLNYKKACDFANTIADFSVLCFSNNDKIAYLSNILARLTSFYVNIGMINDTIAFRKKYNKFFNYSAIKTMYLYLLKNLLNDKIGAIKSITDDNKITMLEDFNMLEKNDTSFADTINIAKNFEKDITLVIAKINSIDTNLFSIEQLNTFTNTLNIYTSYYIHQEQLKLQKADIFTKRQLLKPHYNNIYLLKTILLEVGCKIEELDNFYNDLLKSTSLILTKRCELEIYPTIKTTGKVLVTKGEILISYINKVKKLLTY